MKAGRVWVVILVLAMSVMAGCKGGFPKCKGGKCDPCLDCDHLIGIYSGWMSYVSNDCLGDIDPGLPDQPWSLSFDEILTDEDSGTTYLEFDMTELGYGVVQAGLCGPKDKDGELHHAFCMHLASNSFDSMGVVQQTTTGVLIEAADGSLRFEGMMHNQTRDPVNDTCHVRFMVTADKVPEE